MATAWWVTGDVRDVLAAIPDNSIDLIVTSPPFLALRSYLPAEHPDKHREIGSEPTPAAFLSTLLGLTQEWRRVLAPHGSICVELGDSYAGSGGAGGDYNDGGMRDGQERFDGTAARIRSDPRWPLPKSLCMIPSLYAASLAYGRNLLNPTERFEPWRVRNWVTWGRPNPAVAALGDKRRPASSYLTEACMSSSRYFDLDAVRTEARVQMGREVDGNNIKGSDARSHRFAKRVDSNPAGAPPLDWEWADSYPSDLWDIPTRPYRGSHYAVFPPDLIVKPIKAMCPEKVCRVCGEPSRRITERSDRYAKARADIGDFNQRDREGGKGVSGSRSVLSNAAGADMTCAENVTVGWTDCDCDTPDKWRPGVVVDPFAGSGTTGMVSVGHSRDFIGIDLDERNANLAYERIGGLFLQEIGVDEIGDVLCG